MGSSSITKYRKLAGAMFFVGLVFYSALYAWQAWRAINVRTVSEFAQLSRYGAQATNHYFIDMGGDLQGLSETLAAEGGLAHPTRVNRLLRAFVRIHPDLAAVNVVATDGRILASTMGLSLNARTALKVATSRPIWPHGFGEALHRPGLTIGLPLYGPYSHAWVIPIRYGVASPTGGVSYVLAAILPLATQQKFWTVLPLNAGEHIGLIRSDGYMESIWSSHQKYSRHALYDHRRTGALVRAMAAHPHRPQGSFRGAGGLSDARITGNYARLPDFPDYAVFLSVPTSKLWLQWVAAMHLPLVLLVLLTAGGVLVYGWTERNLNTWEAEREAALARETTLRSLYAALSEINQFIAHHPKPDDLYRRLCESVVQHTRLKLSWIGILSEETNTPSVVSVAGVASAYADGLALSVRESDTTGRGPFGRAMRSGLPVLIQDISADPGFEAWKARAASCGLASSLSVPFVRRGCVTGVLTVYSGEKNFFSDELVNLMKEMAVDLSFSLEDYDRQQQLVQLALHDSLTGLANRQLFIDRLGQALAVARRDERMVGVGVLDLDGFKQVNDRLGHAAGDEVLKQVTRRLLVALRETDTLARLGGDEFGLVICGITHIQELQSILHRALAFLSQPMTLSTRQSIHIAASIGVAVYPFDEGDLSDILRHADLALYRSKESGGHSFAFFEQPLEDEMTDRHQAREEIQNAFLERQFVVHYQPQVHMARGEVVGFEALSRWRHPELGLLFPSAFIDLVEEDPHYIRALGRHVLEQAAIDVLAWREQGLVTSVSVNIGARHLLVPEFMSDLNEIRDRYPEAIRQMVIEVTESDALSDLTQSVTVLEECRRLGVRVAIDDFGSGYASLTYLQRLPIDRIKIDQGFVSGVLDDPKSIAIIASLISAARLLGIEVVAEGVESVDHGNLLLKLCCPLGQGYVIARAMPTDDVCPWARRWTPEPSWARVAVGSCRAEDLPLLMFLTQYDRELKGSLAQLGHRDEGQAPEPDVQTGSQADRFEAALQHWYDGEGARVYGHLPEFEVARGAWKTLCQELRAAFHHASRGDTVSAHRARLLVLDSEMQECLERVRLAGR